MAFRCNPQLDQLVARKDRNALFNDAADSCCTTGYDNDGVTGFDIFENGFQLAERAAARGQEVWMSSPDDVAYFFIGSLEDVCKMLERLPDNPESEE